MGYPTLPGRAIPYHEDGSVLKCIEASVGTVHSVSASEAAELNDQDYVDQGLGSPDIDYTDDGYLVIFFPEQRDITGVFFITTTGAGADAFRGPVSVEGSNDTTNGLDGTWETATAPDGLNDGTHNFDSWRDGGSGGEGWQDISFSSGPYETIRIKVDTSQAGGCQGFYICHVYGSKGAGETPDDIIFVDPDNSNNEFSLPQDFGEVPAGTSQIDKFALQNTSGTLTANNIDLTVDDPEDVIRISSSSGGPWNVSMNITSLGPGAQSADFYVKSEAPAPPTDLEPKRAPINVTVGSWS